MTEKYMHISSCWGPGGLTPNPGLPKGRQMQTASRWKHIVTM